MSIPITIGGESKRMPTKWADLSVKQFYKFVNWKAGIRLGQEPNMVTLYSILLGVPYKTMKKVQVHGLETIVETNLDWLEKPFDGAKLKKPTHVHIQGKKIPVPKDIETTEFGQFLAIEGELRKIVLAKGNEVKRMTATIGILMFYELSDDKFTIARAKRLAPLIEEMSIMEAYPLEVFFWKRFGELRSVKSNGSVVKRISTWLKRESKNLTSSEISRL
jgi:hypothetical protein